MWSVEVLSLRSGRFGGVEPYGANVFCFLSSLPLPSHQGSVWLLPNISLLITNTVSPLLACLSIWLERFHGNQKEDECGPLCINSSMVKLMANASKTACSFLLSLVHVLFQTQSRIQVETQGWSGFTTWLLSLYFPSFFLIGACQVQASLFCYFHQIISTGFLRRKIVFYIEVTTMLISKG